DLGLVNHYYLFGFKKDKGESFPVANHFPSEDIGGMMSVAGAGVLSTSDNRRNAERFVAFLLSDSSQRYFAEQVGEFALAADVPTKGAPSMDSLTSGSEKLAVDLGSLSDLQETLALLRETRVLP
ncbi:MAG: iron ABC transporter substrate-binding protein, partial [Planctomycetota bacterium]|nr:iron ABC transporter substrate-binding protein [Planctomycetota bacterium]